VAIGKNTVKNEVPDSSGDEGCCLRRQGRDMEQVEPRERNPQCEQDPTDACHMIAQTACLPGARMEIAKGETIIEDEVRDKRDLRAHNESYSIGDETVGNLQERVIRAGEAEDIHYGPKPSNTEKAEKPSNSLVSCCSVQVWYLSSHRIFLILCMIGSGLPGWEQVPPGPQVKLRSILPNVKMLQDVSRSV
jgi:hypothetical protein